MAIAKTLYEQDFQVWLSTTINQLQKRKFTVLDTDKLIRAEAFTTSLSKIFSGEI
ncbi:MAG: DUF29 family protein [Microcystis aeruginosa]